LNTARELPNHELRTATKQNNLPFLQAHPVITKFRIEERGNMVEKSAWLE